MAMKILFLDDERMPNDVFWIKYQDDAEFMIVRNLKEFKQAVCNFEFDAISFDHDLGLNEPTGYDCLKWFIDKYLDEELRCLPERIFVHSQNPVGANNIRTNWKNLLDFIEVKNEK